MKKFNNLFLMLCGVALMASCSKLNTMPVFDASESFAAITLTAVSVEENKGQVVIPVEIACIDPVNTTVSYKITDGTAVAGTDYEDTNSSAVLTFKDKSRKENIVIAIKERSGDYTGDLTFTVSLVAATGLKLSSETTCTVKIVDLDHPLASILGDYTVKCNDYYKGALEYKMTLSKDPDDVETVWCNAISPLLVGKGGNWKPNVYGKATKDEETGLFTITFPGGQTLGDVGYGTEGLYVVIWSEDGESLDLDNSTSIVYTQKDAKTFTSDQPLCIYDPGGFWQGGLMTPGTITWTKTE